MAKRSGHLKEAKMNYTVFTLSSSTDIQTTSIFQKLFSSFFFFYTDDFVDVGC